MFEDSINKIRPFDGARVLEGTEGALPNAKVARERATGSSPRLKIGASSVLALGAGSHHTKRYRAKLCASSSAICAKNCADDSPNSMRENLRMKTDFDQQAFIQLIEPFRLDESGNMLSQTDWAKRLGVGESTLRAWIKGTAPNIKSLYRVAERLQRSVPEILGEVPGGFSDWSPDQLDKLRLLLQHLESKGGDPRERVDSVLAVLQAVAAEELMSESRSAPADSQSPS